MFDMRRREFLTLLSGAATFMTRPRRRAPHTGSGFAFSCVSFGTSNQTFPL